MVSIAANGRPFFDALKDLGITAIELQIDPDLTTPHVRRADDTPFSVADDAGIVELKRALDARGIRVPALLLGTDFSGDKADDHVTWAIRSTYVAQALGAAAVRVDPLSRNKELAPETVRDRFILRVKVLLRETAGTNVELGMENHGPFGNDPAFLDAVVSAVDDPRLGMTLDTGNFYWGGVPLEELYHLLERYAPRTKHTHVKNINYPADLAAIRRPIGLDYGKYCCALDEGNIDLRRAIGILRDAGYRRDFCIENESLNKTPAEGRMDVLRRDVEAVARCL
jgi:sugar phosphate isomerase/epimerase